jgi:hypothetical protein
MIPTASEKNRPFSGVDHTTAAKQAVVAVRTDGGPLARRATVSASLFATSEAIGERELRTPMLGF